MNRKELHFTTEEKISLTTGEGNWNTKKIVDKNIQTVRMQDGPHGLRFQEGNGNDINGGGEKTVCFPAACLSAASFDKELLRELGNELGKECQAKNVQLLLGPGINIKRNPLCGRNFEYFSEDPFLSGTLGAAFVEGVQEQGVGACVKHFFANNQEFRRMNSSSNLDERTARELYLPAFEKVIKEAAPWAVMAAYNKVNGIYCTENKKLLTDLLKKEWEYDGVVVSDWGAVHNRAEAIAAGCDLTMPGETSDKMIREAYECGNLTDEELEHTIERIMRLVDKAKVNRKENKKFDYESGHKLAEKIAEESIILLKNEENILPLKAEDKIAYIGTFAKQPRYQGGGSSHISCKKVENALETSRKLMSETEILFAEGYRNNKIELELIEQAKRVAQSVDKAVIFVGLPEEMESEGFDRPHMKIPESHLELIQKVCEVQQNTIVVLHNGSAVEMPWLNQVKGVVECYLGGEAIGMAVSKILFGQVNPSGRLPETFPIYLKDVPSYLTYGGENGQIDYNERMFVGYRYYTSVGRKVTFPFGYGLSYTQFKYSNLYIERKQIADGDKLRASIEIENTGKMDGKEVVQLYIEPPKGEYKRPIRELKGVEKVYLKAGERKSIQFELEYRDFTCYSPEAKRWYAQPGVYQIAVGSSAENIEERGTVTVTGRELILTKHFDESTMMKEFVLHPLGKLFFDTHIEAMIKGMSAAGLIPKDMAETVLIENKEQAMNGMMEQAVSLLLDFSGVSHREREALFMEMNR